MITLIIAFLIFTAGMTFAVLKYGVLESVSAYYYKVPSVVFTGFIWSVAGLMAVSGDGVTFAAGGILFGVGVASNYRWIREQGVHIACAMIAIALGFVSITLMGYWYITLFFAVLAGLIYYFNLKNRTFYIEILAFMCIFAGLIIEKLTNG